MDPSRVTGVGAGGAGSTLSWGEMAVGAPHQVLSGKYRLERELGRGGMGSVWRAQHLTLRSPVATIASLERLEAVVVVLLDDAAILDAEEHAAVGAHRGACLEAT